MNAPVPHRPDENRTSQALPGLAPRDQTPHDPTPPAQGPAGPASPDPGPTGRASSKQLPPNPGAPRDQSPPGAIPDGRPPGDEASVGGSGGGDGAFDEMLAETVHRTGASAGGVYLLDGAGRELGLAVVCGVPSEVAWPWRRLPVDAPVPVAEAVRGDRLVWVGSQDDMARAYPRAAAGLPYRFALAAAPLPGRNRCWGALLLLWPASHPATASRRERSHITQAARQVGRFLDEAVPPPAVPETPRRVPAGTALRPVGGQALQAAVDFTERLPEGALGLDLEGRITFLNGQAEELLGRGAGRLLGTRPWHSLPWLDVAVVEDHYRTAVISRDPVAFSARRPPDTWLRFQLYPDASGISVRITRAPEPVPGQEPGPGRGPGPESGPGPAPGQEPGPGPYAPPPAGSPGTAAEGAPAGAHAGRLYQLVHLASALTEALAVRDVVDLVADQVLPAFGADGLVLSAADAGRLKITGHHGYDRETIDRLDGLPLDTHLTPAGHVLATGTPSFFADAHEMARRYPTATQLSGKQAWAFLPLVVSGRPVGACILSYERPHAFSADERAALTSLAGLVAQALDRARLYDATHDLARGLQQALLPRSVPALPGLAAAARYLPASHGMDVGGDFYDLIRLGPTAAAAVIGDVQGHNVAAAALMGQVRTAIHATAGAPPDEVLARVDRVLADLETDLLVSCLYGHIDLARHEVRLAGAGHPPPLLTRPGRPASVVELDPGPLLGIAPGFSYPVTVLDLAPGTMLAFYTDGLVESPGTDPDRVAAELAGILAAHDGEDLDGLLDRLLGHARPGGHHTDDIALLLMRATATGRE